MMGGMGYSIGLVVHPSRDVQGSVELITRFATERGATVLVRQADAARTTGTVTVVGPDEFVERVDVLVSLGGDGTMLGAMRLVVGRKVPVLGVNHGHLGFLVEVSPDGLAQALERVVNGDFTLESHSCLDVDGGLTAFNDLVMTGVEPFSDMSVDLVVNGIRHGYYRSDALVVCTPMGSTAYNYAAGGPVMSPSSLSVALTPVAPMAGISRSVILGGEDVIALHNPSAERALRLSLDGTTGAELAPGGDIKIKLRGDAVQLVRLDAGAYAQRSRVKLSLLDLPLRRDQLLELIPPALRERAEK
jgi:NAD+ kinase